MIKSSDFICPRRFRHLYSKFKNKEFPLLDVGCGNHTVALAKKWFPKCHYHGLDAQKNYNNSSDDFVKMEKFYLLNLIQDSLDEIPDNFYDMILFVHVIEHLPNGLSVVKELTKKLRQGGQLYVEFPSIRSLTLPSAIGTLNFFDDDTHIRVYDIKEIVNELLSAGCKIIKTGKAREPLRALMFPLFLPLQIYSFAKHGKLDAKYGSWDFFGFADFVLVEKK